RFGETSAYGAKRTLRASFTDIRSVVLAATMLLASLGLGARLLLRWDKTDRQQLSAWRLRRGPNEENVLIMISPVFACDQNVYDFDPLNFKLE
ncbi:MAG: hypothetical protein WBL96_19625, partial [Pseudolabrys sp.]